MIWKDQVNGRFKTRKPKFRNGSMVSIKNGGREVHYRSGLEAEIYECLEVIPEVTRYDVEPIAIDYFFEGKPHKYFPDLTILYADAKVEIWEIKPENQKDLPVNIAKWAAADAYCKSKGWMFTVVTETGLAKLRKIARQTKS